jgi:hypothetical protein
MLDEVISNKIHKLAKYKREVPLALEAHIFLLA